MIECELLTRMQNDLNEALLQYKQNLNEYEEKLQNEFKTEWAKKKFKWFFKNYRQRKLKSKILRSHRRSIFELIEDALEEMLPKSIEISIDNLADIDDITLGDKNYLSEEEIIDKINSFGCTSFSVTPAEIQQLELIDENDFIEWLRQNTFEASGCSLIKED